MSCQRGRPPDGPDRRGRPDQDPAQPAVQRDQVHRTAAACGSPGARGLEITVADTGIGISSPSSRRCSRSSTRHPACAEGAPGSACPTLAGSPNCWAASSPWPASPARAPPSALRLPHDPVVGSALIADDDAAYRQVLGGMLAGPWPRRRGRRRRAGPRRPGSGGTNRPGPGRPADAGYRRICPAGGASRPPCPAIVITAMNLSEPPRGRRCFARTSWPRSAWPSPSGAHRFRAMRDERDSRELH